MPSEMKRLRQLEEENRRLKRLVTNLPLDKEILLRHLEYPGRGQRRRLTVLG